MNSSYQFFQSITKPLPKIESKKLWEEIENYDGDEKDFANIFIKIITELNGKEGHICMEFDRKNAHEISWQANAIAKTHGLWADFSWEENGSVEDGIDALVDWLNPREYCFIRWNLGHDDNYTGFICKKNQLKKLLVLAQKNEFNFMVLQPSSLPPKEYAFVNKGPNNGTLKDALNKAITIAKKKNYQVYLYVRNGDCPPCIFLEKNLLHPLISRVFKGCYIVRVNYGYDAWHYEFDRLPIKIQSLPFFAQITKDAEVTSHILRTGWENSPESVEKELKDFFSDKEEKKSIPVTKKMLQEKLEYDIRLGDFEKVKNLIANLGCDPHWTTDNGQSYLHIACNMVDRYVSREKIIEIAHYFIKQGVDINKRTDSEMTALDEAMSKRYYDLVKLLLENGADVRECKRKDFLYDAISGNHLYLVKLMIDNGADVNARSYTGNPTFHRLIYRVQSGNASLLYDLIKLFLQKGVDLNIADKNGLTPIEIIKSFEPAKPNYKKLLLLIDKYT